MADPEKFLGGVQSQHFVHKIESTQKMYSTKKLQRPGQKGSGGPIGGPPPPSVSPCTCSAVAEDG